MPLCIVPGCVNRSGENYKTQIQKELEKSVKMTFHKLPMNLDKRKKWLDALKITEPRQKKPVVCSLHFDDAAFDRTSLACVRLKDGAVPRVFETAIKGCSVSQEAKILNVTQDCNNLKLDQAMLVTKADVEVQRELHREYSYSKKSLINRSTSISPERFTQAEYRTGKLMINRSTSVSPERRVSTLHSDHLHRALENTKKFYRKKLITLLQKNRRAERRVAALKDILMSINKNSNSA